MATFVSSPLRFSLRQRPRPIWTEFSSSASSLLCCSRVHKSFAVSAYSTTSRRCSKSSQPRASSSAIINKSFFAPSASSSTLLPSVDRYHTGVLGSGSGGQDVRGNVSESPELALRRSLDPESLELAYRPASDDPLRVEHRIPSEALLSPSKTTWKPVPTLSPRVLNKQWQALAKSRLTFLVVLTSMAPYALCPAELSTATSVTTLLYLTLGTTLCSASANAINQLVEAPYDAQMPRTRARPLPSRALTPLHAASFAVVTGMTGVTTLAMAVNPLTAIIGAANIVLYAGVYTPLKRASISNTWVGAVVGALPPLMGWAACTGTLSHMTDLPGWVLAALLYSWQFPHFNSLAHVVRAEYARGGYRMMSVLRPALNRRVGLRHAVACLPICALALPWTGAVYPLAYVILSTPPNVALIHAAWKFWKEGNDKTARYCFWVSLVHLPAVLIAAMVCKVGLWDSVVGRWSGEGMVEGGKGTVEGGSKEAKESQ